MPSLTVHLRSICVFGFSQVPQMSLLSVGNPYNPAKTARQTDTVAPRSEQNTKKGGQIHQHCGGLAWSIQAKILPIVAKTSNFSHRVIGTAATVG